MSERMLLWRKAAECGAVTVLYWNKRPLRQRELPLYAPTKLPEWPEMYDCAEGNPFRSAARTLRALEACVARDTHTPSLVLYSTPRSLG